MVRFKENLSYPDIVMMRLSVNANNMVVLPFVRNRHAAVNRNQVFTVIHITCSKLDHSIYSNY
jgi:hypothetical protein